MFGKSLSEYVAFQRPVLMLIAVVWVMRLGLSMAGMPASGAKFVSVTGVVLLGALYYGWAVGQKDFGSFKQLYGLNLIQGIVSQTLVALAIVLAIVTGQDNIYTIPEFYPPSAGNDSTGLPPDGKNFGHAIAHLVVGAVLIPIVGWLLGSVVHLVTRKRARL
ncbi:MAG: hypothetical protein ACHQM7_09470 [Vicinamibacterales bacterium]|jgi:hypothetical protein